MSFGDHLRTLLEERDMTQKELASQLHIAPSTVGSYVQNMREPDFATLKMLAEFFDVSIDYLLDHHTNLTFSNNENDLLRVFRSLSPEQQELCLAQCKVFVVLNHKKKGYTKSS